MPLTNDSWQIKAAGIDQSDLSFFGTMSIEASSQESRKRRFSIVAYDGGPLRQKNYDYPLVVDIAGFDLGDQIRPILIDHQRDTEHVLGQTDRITASVGELTAEGEVIGQSPSALNVISLNDSGFRFEASIGATPLVKPTFIPRGQSVSVNGRTFQGPIYLSTRTKLTEISFVPIGAAQRSAAHIAASAAGVLEMGFEEWATSKGFDPATLTDQQRQLLMAVYNSEQADTATETPAAPAATASAPSPATAPVAASSNPGNLDIEASDREVIRRSNAIHSVCNGSRGNFPDIEAQAIEEGWDVRRTSLEVVRRARPQAPNVIVRNNERNSGVIEASLAIACGINPNRALERGWYDERTLESADSRNWSNMSLCRFGHEIVAAAGGHLRPGKLDPEGVAHIFECDRRLSQGRWDIQAHGSGGVSTISLAGSLGNVMHKVMLNSFLEVVAVIPSIAVKQSSSDYKEFKAFMINMSGDLEEVGPNGQLPDVTLGEEEFSNKVKLKGAYLSVSEVNFVNDDLGVFAKVPQLFGRKAAIGREKSGFITFLSNPSNFYSTANGNYMEGANTALSIDALTAANKLADEQVDASEEGDPIILPMTRILVPPSLKVEAGSFYSEKNIVISGTTDRLKTVNNPHVGTFEPVSSPFLGTKFGLTNSSDSAWYLLPAQGDLAPLQVVYLNGQENPTVEKGEVDFRTLGVAWRVTYRIGFAKGNKRTVVKSKGSA